MSESCILLYINTQINWNVSYMSILLPVAIVVRSFINSSEPVGYVAVRDPKLRVRQLFTYLGT